MPGPVLGCLLEELQGVAADPVVHVGLLGQGRGPGRREVADRTVAVQAVLHVLDVRLQQPALPEVRQVGVRRLIRPRLDVRRKVPGSVDVDASRLREVAPVGTDHRALAGNLDPIREAHRVEGVRPVQSPGRRVHVEVNVADSDRLVAGLVAKPGVQRRPVDRVVLVRPGATPVVLQPGGQTGPRGRTQRRGTDRVREVDAPLSQGVEVRRTDRDVGVAPHPVVALLVGEHEQDVRSRGHW